MAHPVKLIGLDFGTTTSSAVVASAQLLHNSVTGRMELSAVQEVFRSPMVFTPFLGDRLDLEGLERHLDDWLTTCGLRHEEIFGGGALLTGLTAQKENAAALVDLVRRRLGNALIATADDPCLESWLAFMGSCGGLSSDRPETLFLNLDIGGGTTNLALGQAGQVNRTGCLFIGARHVQVEPGSYRIVNLSRYARAAFRELGIHKDIGDPLGEAELGRYLDFQVSLLEAAATGTPGLLQTPLGRLHEQVPLRLAGGGGTPVITFSGGVGALLYAHGRGAPWPARTCFGDLGIDLARRILASPFLARDVQTVVPAGGGRATCYGLLRHNTEVSGSTLHLARPETLPLVDLPIFGVLSCADDRAAMRNLLDLVRRSPRGGALQITLGGREEQAIRMLGRAFAEELRLNPLPEGLPLALFVRENVGKVLGQYATDWGALPVNLLVLDELIVRNAQFAQVGCLRGQVVPVSFYGLN